MCLQYFSAVNIAALYETLNMKIIITETQVTGITVALES